MKKKKISEERGSIGEFFSIVIFGQLWRSLLPNGILYDMAMELYIKLKQE